MAEGLENLVNTSPVDANYPWKNIKDNTGVGDGTPLDKISHADYHQTFRKLLSLAGIAPNGLPDNVANGYQYIDALCKLFSRSVISAQFPPALAVGATFNGGVLSTAAYGAGNYRIRVEMNFVTGGSAHAIDIKLRDSTNAVDLTNSERHITTPANSGASVVLFWEGALPNNATVDVNMFGGVGSMVIQNAQYFIDKL